MKQINQNKIGHLEIYTGCMFSGKTDALIATLFRLRRARQNILVFKPEIDQRSNITEIKSQTKKTWPAISIVHPQEIQTKIENSVNVDGIAIDETQFFDLNLLPFVESWLDNGYDVYISGLDRGFSDNNLPVMNHLLALADRVIKLFAYCNKCGTIANKTQRINNNGNAVFPSIKKDAEFVGGVNLYEPRCRKCYVRFSKK